MVLEITCRALFGHVLSTPYAVTVEQCGLLIYAGGIIQVHMAGV